MSDNIVLITIDSLRADCCGFLGGNDELTPTLDDLANESVVFERAIAPGPRTPSSMPVAFTGEFFRRSDRGVYRSYEQKSTRWRERRARIGHHMDRFRTLPERLQARGYETGAVTANPWTTPATNFDGGFDVFQAVGENEDVSANSLPIARAAGSLLDSGVNEWLLTWPDFYDRITEVRTQLSEPYFLWVFLLDPHQPYLTPRRYREENSAIGMYYGNIQYNRSYSYTDPLPRRLETRLVRAYRDTVRSVDAFVGRLRANLAEDDPALIVHADHGESFREHGTYGHRPQLYRENLHVPLIAHNVGERGRVSAPVALRDLSDLVARIAGGSGFDPRAFARPFVIGETEERERVGVRTDEWAYVTANDTFEGYLHGFESEELYHLATDPEEARNVVDDAPSQARLLRRVLDHHESHENERAGIGAAVASLDVEG